MAVKLEGDYSAMDDQVRAAASWPSDGKLPIMSGVKASPSPERTPVRAPRHGDQAGHPSVVCLLAFMYQMCQRSGRRWIPCQSGQASPIWASQRPPVRQGMQSRKSLKKSLHCVGAHRGLAKLSRREACNLHRFFSPNSAS